MPSIVAAASTLELTDAPVVDVIISEPPVAEATTPVPTVVVFVPEPTDRPTLGSSDAPTE